MSGGGPSSTSNGGDESVPCDNLSFTTTISSPQEDEIRDLQPDTTLPIQYRDGRVLIVSEHTGNTVGSINWPGIDRLIECMEAGTTYAARVLSVNGGQVRIRVTAVA